MVFDYLLWRGNGLGFHITNFLFLILTGFVVFFLVWELEEINQNANSGCAQQLSNLSWPFFASGLFILYPLHPETISWITGRVDAIAAFYYFASLWCYIRWRRTDTRIWALGALVGMTLSLLSKEMAITLPLSFLLYDLLFLHNRQKRNIWEILVSECPFWILLVLYFVVRRLALGTFIGGYDSTLSLQSDLGQYASKWLHGLVMMAEPINSAIIKPSNFLCRIWTIGIVASIALAACKLITSRTYWKTAIFLVFLFLLCLLPVYKIFDISSDLQSSRYAYFATVPLCILLTIGLSSLTTSVSSRTQSIFNVLKFLLGITLLFEASILLSKNNSAWSVAGHQANAIKHSLDQILSTNDIRPVFLFGAPDNYKGAYIYRNALVGMLSKPEMTPLPRTQIINLAMVPFSSIKDLIEQYPQSIRVYHWNDYSNSFAQVKTPRMLFPKPQTLMPHQNPNRMGGSRIAHPDPSIKPLLWNRPSSYSNVSGFPQETKPSLPKDYLLIHGALRKALNYDQGATITWQWSKNDELSMDSSSENQIIHINPDKILRWSTDFIALEISAKDKLSNLSELKAADLHFSNNLCTDQDIQSTVTAFNGNEVLIFPLRNNPEWTFGNKLDHLDITLPPVGTLTLRAMHFISADQVMPKLQLPAGNSLLKNGYVNIGRQKNASLMLRADANAINGAKALVMEITRANQAFEKANVPNSNSILLLKQITFTSALCKVNLKPSDFPKPGMYQIRFVAYDQQNNQVGMPSDSLTIVVE